MRVAERPAYIVAMATPIDVVKVGGSLLDLPDLIARLAMFCIPHIEPRMIFVCGGGPAADTVRRIDRHVGLDEETAHWLCIHAMAFNSRVLAAALPRGELVPDLSGAQAARRRRCRLIRGI